MDKELMMSWLEQGVLSIPQLLLKKYKQLGLNETELVLLLQVYSFLEDGIYFPTPKDLADRMVISENQCVMMLRRLIQQQFLAIEEGSKDETILFERYSIKPLFLKLIDEFIYDKKQDELEKNLLEETDLYTIFEQEFGRPLSPLECETLAMWIDQDQQTPEIIRAALREAVISGKLSFRYIDRILFDWKKNNIRTVEAAREYGKKFHQQRKQVSGNGNGKSPNAVPFYNWLEK
ncbi:DnaD domain-containing protein [Heyndrickxia ginsengihumi]|uniref:DNA replication protein DnaD n=1 Tax=Heyndrickxia ginsengihumi TaxID=363870 RepID=A0A0A6VAI5_9BACI|nr:DnaD domain-containing protein [Heyndrickxia ginsengihumi]KHD84518.1 DNA replication protein DnaD [Heyndrickxia ginsengihumi]MBE6185529.1 DnaD domain protein [Bacillus sp. (in: firmicutes)]MCM3022950.1 DnaD domain-containing protein [Heyndrickxia ginsengihumi]NEY20622.1 DnaD domain-containing protein [Heyndrickxia ginsengihumi]